MTDKERIKCKYKFQDKEKFDGKTYCTCFCELCEDLPPCDDNCQIYEDFKQLARKTQIINEIEEAIKPYQEPIELDALSLPGAIESILERKTKECDTLKSQLDFAVQQKESFEQECEELQEKLRELELKNTTLQNRNQQLDGVITECDRYRKALEDIEEATKKISNYLNIGCDMTKCEDCNHFESFCTNQCVCYLIEQGDSILDIINKAKGEGK